MKPGASTPEDQYKPDREKPVTAHRLVMWEAVEKIPLVEGSEAEASTPEERKSRTRAGCCTKDGTGVPQPSSAFYWQRYADRSPHLIVRVLLQKRHRQGTGDSSFDENKPNRDEIGGGIVAQAMDEALQCTRT